MLFYKNAVIYVQEEDFIEQRVGPSIHARPFNLNSIRKANWSFKNSTTFLLLLEL